MAALFDLAHCAFFPHDSLDDSARADMAVWGMSYLGKSGAALLGDYISTRTLTRLLGCVRGKVSRDGGRRQTRSIGAGRDVFMARI